MKTMHHFCDNCLNYYSKWMAHLGWSLLSASEKRQLLSFIYFIYLLCNTEPFFRDHRSRWQDFAWFQVVCARGSRVPAWDGDLSAAASPTSVAAALLHGAAPAKFSLRDLSRRVRHPFIHPFIRGQWSQCIGNMGGVGGCGVYSWVT